ncbi:MAG: response regulator [Sphingomonas sp.]|nr:response regulator [Sphingomonas sp.]
MRINSSAPNSSIRLTSACSLAGAGTSCAAYGRTTSSTSVIICDHGSEALSDAEDLAGFHVLVVEDHYFQARDCCEWLRDAGALVAGPVGDVRHARDVLETQRVDGAVVDINLGDGPDFELAWQLTDRRVPFIFATGYDEKIIPADFQEALVLQKPFGPQDLIAAVRSLR